MPAPTSAAHPAPPRSPPPAAHPADIDPAQVERIRQAAYLLPQVVAPADLQVDGAAATDELLDQRGFVLLQKAAAGAPAEPLDRCRADRHRALRHLDAVGSGRGVRAQMLARHARLDAARHPAQQWQWLAAPASASS